MSANNGFNYQQPEQKGGLIPSKGRHSSATSNEKLAMLHAILLSCLLSSASAFHVVAPSPAMEKITSLRGGGDLAPVVVSATAFIGGATGLSMYIGTKRFTKVLWLGLNEFPHDPYIAIAMIGWAIGKLNAVMAGPESTRRFAQLNCIPLMLWLATNFKGGAKLTTSIIPAALFAAYVYAGYIEQA